MRKLHIMGAAGSGKTTLARWCGRRLNVPWYELDAVGYENGSGAKRTLEERLTTLHEISIKPGWVTEGFYLWWVDELLKAADAIVWLDLPWYVSMPRIVTRHVKLSWAGKNRHPGVRNLANFVWGCRPYYLETVPRKPTARDDDGAVNRVGVAQYLKPYMKKVVHCQRPTDVKRFLGSL